MSDDNKVTVIHVGGTADNATIENVPDEDVCHCPMQAWPHKRADNGCGSGMTDEIALMMVAMYLATIAESDPSHRSEGGDYRRRNAAIYMVLAWATHLGWTYGIGFDGAEPNRPVAYVDLPGRGQVSWHLVGYAAPYDGHTTAEKYDRVRGWIRDFDAATRPDPQEDHPEDCGCPRCTTDAEENDA